MPPLCTHFAKPRVWNSPRPPHLFHFSVYLLPLIPTIAPWLGLSVGLVPLLRAPKASQTGARHRSSLHGINDVLLAGLWGPSTSIPRMLPDAVGAQEGFWHEWDGRRRLMEGEGQGLSFPKLLTALRMLPITPNICANGENK